MTEKNIISQNTSKRSAADVLEGNLDEICEIYERKLMEEQNLLASGGSGNREMLHGQASSLLRRAAATLRGEHSEGLEEEIHFHTEAAQTSLIQHPDESFRAGVALCAAALEVILAKVNLSGEPPEFVVDLSLVVQRSVMDHVARVAMVSYVDYLLMKIEEIQVEERHRFSRDLHDHIAHSMALVKQNLELFSAMRGKDEAAAEAKLKNARETASEAMETARSMALELRRSDTGKSLRAALDDLVQSSVPPEFEVEVEVSGDEGIPAHMRDQIYIALREGLRNAVSHSGGRRIKLKVEVSGEEAVASVEDWGDGFDASDSSEGVGLRSMRERTKLMRGSFDVSSTPGKGTRAEIRVPLTKKRSG